MKTPARFLALALCAALAPVASPALRAAACCQAELPAAVPLPATSLYQAEVGFTTDVATPFRLAELRGHPVALVMFFSSCTYACPATVADLTRIRDALPAATRAITRIVMVSFDAERDTVAVLHQFREARALDANWVLLRGTDDSVRELAALLGVKFKRGADGSFAHSNLITILSPEGEIVHQRAGLTGGLPEATAALAAAAAAAPTAADL
jgi:protein SCO1